MVADSLVLADGEPEEFPGRVGCDGVSGNSRQMSPSSHGMVLCLGSVFWVIVNVLS